MKYAFEMGSGAMICIQQSFIKIGSGIQKLLGEDKLRDTQQGELISTFLLFQNKESGLKVAYRHPVLSSATSGDPGTPN
jgi:hypothetical protein